MIKAFLVEEDGLGTVELLLILAGLVAVALLFKGKLHGFVSEATKNIFDGKAKSETVIQ